MEIFQIRMFQTQIRDQCLFIIEFAKQMNTGIQNSDEIIIFSSIQNILNAGANISKMLWGQKGKSSDARRKLRESIGIADNSPLRNTTMRNHFEHIDERLDRWWTDSEKHNHADKIIGPQNLISGLDNIDIFRWYNPDSQEIIFWGEKFNIQEIVSEVLKILPTVDLEAGKDHWE